MTKTSANNSNRSGLWPDRKMKISYKELAEHILAMPLERQEDDVTVFVTGVGESYVALEFGTAMNVDQQGDLEGVLEQGHFVIKI